MNGTNVDPRTQGGKLITDPLEFCQELEAYLCFRLTADVPSIEESEMRAIKLSLVYLLSSNGCKL